MNAMPGMYGMNAIPGMYGMNAMPGMYGMNGLYGMNGMYPFNPYFPGPIHPMMPNIMPPVVTNPSHLGAGPGAESISAALNLPLPKASSDENIAGHLGNYVQLPVVPKKTNIPLSLLSSNVPKPENPQIGSIAIQAPIANEPQNTAPLPKLY